VELQGSEPHKGNGVERDVLSKGTGVTASPLRGGAGNLNKLERGG
jgi:hypothetical protein